MVNPVGGANPVSENLPASSQQALQAFNTGIDNFQGNPPDYNKACTAFKEALSLDRSAVLQQYPQAYYLLGLAAQYSTPPDPDAKKYLEIYINQPNADPKILQSAQGQVDIIDGQNALNAGDYSAALAVFEKAGKDDPSLAPNLAGTIGQIKGQIDLNNANEAQQKNDVAGMLQWYEQAAADDPQMAPQLASTIAQLKPQVAFQTNDYPKIQAVLQQAQGMVYPPQGTGQASDVPGAVALLQGVLQQYPNLSDFIDPAMIQCPLAEYQAQLAAYPPGFQMQGHPEDAIKIMQAAVAKYPTIPEQDPGYYLTMAQYAWSAGNVDQARQIFNQFGPYLSQYQEAYKDMTGPQQFAQQIGGSANAVLANWMSYAANLLGHTKGFDLGSTQWWQNNVLSAAQGIMPSGAYYKAGSKHLKNVGYKVEREPDALKPLQAQEAELKQAKSMAGSAKEKAKIEEELGRNQAAQQKVRDAQNGKAVEPDKHEEGVTTQRSYRWGGDVTATTRTGGDDSREERPAGKFQGAAEDPSGPGYWGMGSTLQQAQAVYKSFGNISAANPYTLASGGTGVEAYQESAYGGANFLNAEARTFSMVYGGGTGAGFGLQNMYGAQARADVFDESYGVNYAGGNYSVGGQNFSTQQGDALVSGNASESVALGSTQADAHGAASIGTKGVHLGGNAGVFAGAAQGTVTGSLNILGQGGFANAQGWIGAGAKLNASIGLGPDGLHFDLGIGAALGIGGYVQLSGNINLQAIGQDLAAIYGTGEHTVVGMVSRAGELAGSAVSAVGDMASNVAGGIDTAVGKAQDYFADHALDNMTHADNAGQFFEGVGEGVGEIATDVAEATAEPILDAAKEVGKAASKVGSDISKGKIGDAIVDTVVGGAKAIWDTAKDTVKAIGHAFKNFFNWL